MIQRNNYKTHLSLKNYHINKENPTVVSLNSFMYISKSFARIIACILRQKKKMASR